MRIGWRTYLKRKFQSKSSISAVGIAVSQDMVTFTALKGPADNLQVQAEESVSISHWGEHLRRWVDIHQARGTPCYAAFSLHGYQLLQIDRPGVPEQELHAALSWSVKELVSQDQMVVHDYFDVPVPIGGNQKINLVALPKDQVQAVCEHIHHSGLLLHSLSVEELATCDLLPCQPEPVLTLVQEAGEEVVLNIVKDGQLYVSRRLKGFENLGSFTEQELQMGLADSLSVQIQRSMDYFESQMRQPPVRQIRLRLDTPHLDVLARQINQFVPAEVSELLPDVRVNAPHSLPRLNYISLGMALSHYRRSPADLTREAAQ